MRKVRAAFQVSGYEQAAESVFQNTVSAENSPQASVSATPAIRAQLRPMALYDHP
ncbi:hypothetical protein [Pseudochrobactrum asaccharolyticum]|uniref:hypothetical protein n=1 Tax=Pseudochrobactrum asaccharolyticum TaxID=354351 RepID=UPI0013C52ABA|nr:hypothetical protein [Pseudochrobactrum asaccharolyticum]